MGVQVDVEDQSGGCWEDDGSSSQKAGGGGEEKPERFQRQRGQNLMAGLGVGSKGKINELRPRFPHKTGRQGCAE